MQDLEQLIQNAGDLPTIPVVATKVMQLIQNETTTAEDLARVIAADPAVTARVLKISNSSFYGCQRQIQTLSHAIMILGFGTLKSLVVAASVNQVYKPYGLTEKLLWEHSFGVGLAAKMIAGFTRVVNEEEAFLAGLFHDIGKIIMNALDNARFKEVIQKCYNEEMRFEEAERQVYDYTHAEVGALVIRKWNFPENLMTVAMKHHNLDFGDEDDPYLVKLTMVTALADAMCIRLGIGERSPREDLDLYGAKPTLQLGLDATTINVMIERFEEAFEADRASFV